MIKFIKNFNAYILIFFTWNYSAIASDNIATEAVLDRPLPVIQSVFTGAHTYEVTEYRRATHSNKLVQTRQYSKLLAFHLRSEPSKDVQNLETPYAFYNVLGHGILTGVNVQNGKNLIQVFVAFDVGGSIHDVYVQRIDSDVKIGNFRTRAYRSAFRKFSSAYFLDEAYTPPPTPLPDMLTLKVHDTVLRGVRLCILNYITFWLNRPQELLKVNL